MTPAALSCLALPHPATCEMQLSKAVSAVEQGGAAAQQRAEEVRGTYPGAASDTSTKEQVEAAAAARKP